MIMLVMVCYLFALLVNAHDDSTHPPTQPHVPSTAEWNNRVKMLTSAQFVHQIQVNELNRDLTIIGNIIRKEQRELDHLIVLADNSPSNHRVDALLKAVEEQIKYYSSAVYDIGSLITSLNQDALLIDQSLIQVKSLLKLATLPHHDIEHRLEDVDKLLQVGKVSIPNIRRSIVLLQAEFKQHECSVQVWIEELWKLLEPSQ